MTSSSNTTFSDYVKCPDCGGDGEYEVEVAVIDHSNGGFIKGIMQTCEFCDGDGEVHEEDAAEFLINIEFEQ
ncbi:hypothetical protein N9B14_01380 [Akkermansiaceae bacterium]|nr:hypothetical protein [Akkermansiaceae bacterium]